VLNSDHSPRCSYSTPTISTGLKAKVVRVVGSREYIACFSGVSSLYSSMRSSYILQPWQHPRRAAGDAPRRYFSNCWVILIKPNRMTSFFMFSKSNRMASFFMFSKTNRMTSFFMFSKTNRMTSFLMFCRHSGASYILVSCALI
jgi:hypothetical protein